MSQDAVIKKNEALRRVREALRVCPKCGEPYDEVHANSHKTSEEATSVAAPSAAKRARA